MDVAKSQIRSQMLQMPKLLQRNWLVTDDSSFYGITLLYALFLPFLLLGIHFSNSFRIL